MLILAFLVYFVSINWNYCVERVTFYVFYGRACLETAKFSTDLWLRFIYSNMYLSITGGNQKKFVVTYISASGGRRFWNLPVAKKLLDSVWYYYAYDFWEPNGSSYTELISMSRITCPLLKIISKVPRALSPLNSSVLIFRGDLALSSEVLFYTGFHAKA